MFKKPNQNPKNRIPVTVGQGETSHTTDPTSSKQKKINTI